MCLSEAMGVFGAVEAGVLEGPVCAASVGLNSAVITSLYRGKG